MLSFIISFQVCYSGLKGKFKKNSLKFEFDSSCDVKGTQLLVNFTTQLPSQQFMTLSKIVTVDEDLEAEVKFNCSDLADLTLFDLCLRAAKSVTQSFNGNLFISPVLNPTQIEDFPLQIKFEEKKKSENQNKSGLIIGASIGAVVLIGIIVLAVFLSKRFQKKQKRPEPLLIVQYQPSQLFPAELPFDFPKRIQ
ncbi:Hypothetical_protein [Hexamita inflata]|uniref:Hypothetical_protein n=1 Tax=Hexamita inflata TaxID=28002 RepID=A0ABP1H6P5_9EUKA